MPPWFVIAASVVGLVALLLQNWLEPFFAGSHMGLFTNGGDLDVYRHGALQVVHGDALYAAELPPGGWFTYPPFAALVFIPLSAVGFAAAKVLWFLMSFAVLVAIIWRCSTTLGYRADWPLGLCSLALALVALDVEAVRGTLWQGQVNLVLVAIIVWDLTRPQGSRLRGWSVGVAVGMKLVAVVFVPYLLVTRQWRSALVATSMALATVALTWCVLPSDSAQYWLHAVFHTDRIGRLTHPGNYSIGGIMATVWAPAPMPTLGWLAAEGVAAVVGLYAARRADAAGHGLLAITIVGLLSCTVPPLAWGHHWVWAVPLLAVTMDHVVRSAGRARWSWVAATGVVYLVSFMWFNGWLYRTSLRIDANYPTYVDALDAAIGHMTKADKLLVVSTHPALFVAVAIVTIALTRGAKTELTQTNPVR